MRPRGASRACVGVVGLSFLALFAPPAQADTFHLKGGGQVEGQVLEDRGEALRVRTTIGTVDLDKEQIVKQIAGPSPWERYDVEKKRYTNTASDQFRLAQWCAKNGLRSEEIDHLRRVIKLDPEHAAARKALGFVKDKGQWVKRPVRPPPDPAQRQAKKQAKSDDEKIRRIVAEWFVQVQAIHRGRLEGEVDPTTKRFRDGREQILSIREPLALPAITTILSAGTDLVRRLMVESLAQFDVDEATMNLVVVTLLDPSPAIRKAAAIELVERNDPRIVGTLLDALNNGEEFVLRNAATALGFLKAGEAVEDLIAHLSIETRQSVLVSGPVYLDSIWHVFGRSRQYWWGDDPFWYQPACIGCLGPGTLIGTTTWREVHWVSIHRTEVQEALIAITGQNLGFDAEAWRLWWKQNGKK
ncbi:MAG TPA: HEAT repeat domain-containing protein [Phycisphaerae bacterium]|nr:HEAT repeat domain-containing protein [Phycisphaerae bacterium]